MLVPHTNAPMALAERDCVRICVCKDACGFRIFDNLAHQIRKVAGGLILPSLNS